MIGPHSTAKATAAKTNTAVAKLPEVAMLLPPGGADCQLWSDNDTEGSQKVEEGAREVGSHEEAPSN